MANSTTITLNEIHPTIRGAEFRNHGCFGAHNCFSHYQTLSHNRNNGGNSGQFTADMEVIEFWPHLSDNTIAEKVRDAVNVYNSIGFWKDFFVVSPANSIWVNLREHPADKVFTGFMSIRDYMDGYYGGYEFLWENIPNLSEEDILLRKRIGLFLKVSGVSIDIFGRVNIGSGTNRGSESTSIYLTPEMDALTAYFFAHGTGEECSDCWAQEPVGVGENYDGYLRNHSSGLGRVGTRRGYPGYTSMSSWLYEWIHNDGHKDRHFDDLRGRLTCRQVFDRIRTRMPQVNSAAERAQIIIDIFEEIKDMYS